MTTKGASNGKDGQTKTTETSARQDDTCLEICAGEEPEQDDQRKHIDNASNDHRKNLRSRSRNPDVVRQAHEVKSEVQRACSDGRQHGTQQKQ